MIHILTSTSTILKVEVRPQESRVGDSNVKGVLSLKLKQTLSDESFTEQQHYLQSSATAAYVSLNKLDQASRFRTSVNLVSCNSNTFNFTQGSSSSGLGYSLACFDAWWISKLNKGSHFNFPVFATGEVLSSGQINPVAHITEKIESVCNYVEENKGTISSFYFCYPESNDEDISLLLKKRLVELGGKLVASNRLQQTLGELLGKSYDGDPLGRWLPFKGLNSFNYEDSVRFFGRDKDVERIYNDIEHNNGLLIVSGASGTGKSSLIKAGLIPKLEQECSSLYWASCTPNSLPPSLGILKFILGQLIQAWSLPCEDVNEIAEMFNSSEEDGIAFIQKFLTSESPKCLLYLDQYEEVFSQSEQGINVIANELSIIDLLAKSLAPLNIVLAIRNEYLDCLLDSQALRSPVISNVTSQLTPQQWQSIVHEQALFSGVNFEQSEGVDGNMSLDALIVEEAIQIPFALPMVSFLLEQLYYKSSEEEHSSTTLLYKHYRELGGLSGVTAYRASKVMQENSPSEQLMSQFFNYFVGITPEGLPYAKHVLPAKLEQTNKELYKLVNKFIDANLIVSVESEKVGVRLVNESLFSEWTLLKKWFFDNKNYLTWRNVIEPKFVKWKSCESVDLERDTSGKSPLGLIIEGMNDYKKDNKINTFELTDFSLLMEGKKYGVNGLIIDNQLKKYLNHSLKEKLHFIFWTVCLAFFIF